jgi:hypothetical protein
MNSVYGMKPGDVFWAARYCLLLSALRSSLSVDSAEILISYIMFDILHHVCLLHFIFHLVRVFFAFLLSSLIVIFPLSFSLLLPLLPLFPLVM